MAEPLLSVIIPTLNRPQSVRAVVRQVLAQLPAQADLWVIDQSKASIQRDLARWCGSVSPQVHHLSRANPGLPAARNAGISASRGRVVLFFDDDVHLLPGCLQAHLAAYAHPQVGGVGGRIAEARLVPNAPQTTNRIGRSGRIKTNLWGTRPQWIQTLKGANMSFRRQALHQVGGFDEGYLGTALLEDADMSKRVSKAGWKLLFEPRAEVVHHALGTGGVRVGSERDAMRWRMYNTARFVRKHRKPWQWPPVALTLGLLAAHRAIAWKDPTAAGHLVHGAVSGWLSMETN